MSFGVIKSSPSAFTSRAEALPPPDLIAAASAFVCFGTVRVPPNNGTRIRFTEELMARKEPRDETLEDGGIASLPLLILRRAELVGSDDRRSWG